MMGSWYRVCSLLKWTCGLNCCWVCAVWTSGSTLYILRRQGEGTSCGIKRLFRGNLTWTTLSMTTQVAWFFANFTEYEGAIWYVCGRDHASSCSTPTDYKNTCQDTKIGESNHSPRLIVQWPRLLNCMLTKSGWGSTIYGITCYCVIDPGNLKLRDAIAFAYSNILSTAAQYVEKTESDDSAVVVQWDMTDIWSKDGHHVQVGVILDDE